MVPSGSVPLPVKVHVCQTVAGMGEIEVMVAEGGVLEEEPPIYVTLSSALLASLSSEKSAWRMVVLDSMVSDALSPADQVPRPPIRHQAISATAAGPKFIQGVQDPEDGSGRDA